MVQSTELILAAIVPFPVASSGSIIAYIQSSSTETTKSLKVSTVLLLNTVKS